MPRPPSYLKVNPAEQPIFYLALSSSVAPFYTIDEYAETLIAQRLSMVDGVSRVQVYGAQKYAVRVQVDPEQLAARGIGIDDVQKAIGRRQYQSPDRPHQRPEPVIHGDVHRAAHQRLRLPAVDRCLSQWCAGSAGAVGNRHR